MTQMITIFIGEDTQGARKALRKALDEVKKEGESSIQRFSDVNFSSMSLNEAVFAQNLFGDKNIIVIDGILDNPEGALYYSLALKDTPNHVFIRETAPNKEILTILKKIGGMVSEFPLLKKKPENTFAIADALTARDKKVAWIEYLRAKERGSVAEEIHGTIWWATKLLYLCATLEKEEAIKAGVSQYNYQRYLNNSKKFLTSEIEDRLRILKNMYHEAHHGEVDFDAALEQYLLTA